MITVSKPLYRNLKGYALDPSYSLKTETYFANEIVYKVPWEEEPTFGPGPSGEYVDVRDWDENDLSEFCPPINLNEAAILASDGLPIDETNFQFHQQMVYAVAMTTIKNFENGLGRPLLWSQDFSETLAKPKRGRKAKQQLERKPFVRTLKMYPHAFRHPNAFFNNQRNAAYFGYFKSMSVDVRLQLPGSFIYSCLSHDIVAHTTVHAIINGLYKSYIEDTNPDVYAFQEFLADSMAIFQHFSFPEFTHQEIKRTNGDFKRHNYLLDLAAQFGIAVGQGGALRSALGKFNPETKKWELNIPKGDEYQTVREPHERGKLLTSTIFEAFRIIYERQIADLRRIAKHNGVLGEDIIDTDLVNRFAEVASKTARHLRNICIRGLDYCPPTDLTFGDFLRAIITADRDLFEEDERKYRTAIIEAFISRGIYPVELPSISELSLCYESLANDKKVNKLFRPIVMFLRDYRKKIITAKSREEIHSITNDFIYGSEEMELQGLYERIIRDRTFRRSAEIAKLTGLCLGEGWKELGIPTSESFNIPTPAFEIQSLHLASRINGDGKQTNNIILSLVQRARIDVVMQGKGIHVKPHSSAKNKEDASHSMSFTGGCTMIFDLQSLALCYCISKPIINTRSIKSGYSLNTRRIRAIYSYMTESGMVDVGHQH